MESGERSELYSSPSDYGCFQLKVSSVTDSSTQEKSLVRHYRCNSSAIQQLRQTWVFVNDHSHPHLGTVKRIDGSATELTVYTEYHPTTLAKWLENYETCPWDVESTARQLTGLVEVLAEAQRNQVTHRRLTPDYIYLDETCSTLKLMDFAPCSLDAEDDQLFVRNLNPRYLSPERCSGHWTFSLQNVAKADVYSLGMVALDIIYSHDAPKHPLSSLLEALSEAPALKQILDPMLQIDPQQRPDFIELLTHLKSHPSPIEEAKLPVTSTPIVKCSKCNKPCNTTPEKERSCCENCHRNIGLLTTPEHPQPVQSSEDTSPIQPSKPVLQPKQLSEYQSPKSQPSEIKPLVVSVHCAKCSKSFVLNRTEGWRQTQTEENGKYCSQTCFNTRVQKAQSGYRAVPKAAPQGTTVAYDPVSSGSYPPNNLQPPRVPEVRPQTTSPPAGVTQSGSGLLWCPACTESFSPHSASGLPPEYYHYIQFCSEECQIKYHLALGDEFTISRRFRKDTTQSCLWCHSLLPQTGCLPLPCDPTHCFCNKDCAKQFVEWSLAQLPEEHKDLSLITCPLCEKEVPRGTSEQWLRAESFPGVPRSEPNPLSSHRASIQTPRCDKCSSLSDFQAKCGHHFCLNCIVTQRTGMDCPKCRTKVI